MKTRGKLTDSFNAHRYVDALQRNDIRNDEFGDNDPQAVAYEKWVVGLTGSKHDEKGVGPGGTLDWQHRRGEEQLQSPDDIYQTYIITPKDNDTEIAATITLTHTDRDAAKNLNPSLKPIFFAFTVVDEKYRNGKLGHNMVAFVADQVESYVKDHPEQGVVVAGFTDTPSVRRKLQHAGMQFVERRTFEGRSMEEDLYALEILAPKAVPVIG